MSDDKIARCELCGEPMPDGEEMFKYHGYSSTCPKPPLPKSETPRTDRVFDGSHLWGGFIHEFARQLERELTAVCEERDRFRKGSEYLESILQCEQESGVCVMVHSYPSYGREACNPENCRNVKSDCPEHLRNKLERKKT